MTPALCLAVAIAMEARGEPVSGMGAVADVIMTRVDDPRYPNTVCKVVLEQGAFPWNSSGLPKPPVSGDDWQLIQDLATDAITSNQRWIIATHYHTTSVRPYWAAHYDEVSRVGSHIFYMNNTRYK